MFVDIAATHFKRRVAGDHIAFDAPANGAPPSIVGSKH
jgi:hypothetical protein